MNAYKITLLRDCIIHSGGTMSGKHHVVFAHSVDEALTVLRAARPKLVDHVESIERIGEAVEYDIEVPITGEIDGVDLIDNFTDHIGGYAREDSPRENLGIGLMIKRNLAIERVAVVMPLNPAREDVEEAWGLLRHAISSGEGVVYGDQPLKGKEIKVSSLR